MAIPREVVEQCCECNGGDFDDRDRQNDSSNLKLSIPKGTRMNYTPEDKDFSTTGHLGRSIEYVVVRTLNCFLFVDYDCVSFDTKDDKGDYEGNVENDDS